MVKLYKSQSEITHIVYSRYLLCNPQFGKVVPNSEGTRNEVTCKNCLSRFHFD